MMRRQVIFILNLTLLSYGWRAVIKVPTSPSAYAKQHPNIYVFETDEEGNQQNLTLPCIIVEPSPTVNYAWFREDQELSGSMVNGEGSLIVPNITEGEYASRKGVDYYCIARDNIGFDVAVRSRNITVYYAYFNGFERMAESNEGTIEVFVPVALNSAVALECDVLDAKPPPQIKWFDDQGEIQEIQNGNRVRFLDSGRYLYMNRLQAVHLQRQYYCVVTNANLSKEISAPTRYLLTDNLTQGILVDYKQIGNLRAFVGNSNFEFAFVGGVYGDIVNETISILTVDGREVAILGNIGIIREISMPGIFFLEASITYNGLMALRNGTLTVYEIPRITHTISDERDYFIGGQNLTYTCQFEGFPPPNVTFYFNGAAISLGSGVIVIDNNLIIPSPQVFHSGVYQCIVSNEIGDDQVAWLVEVREPIISQVQQYNYSEHNVSFDRNVGALIVLNSSSTVRFSVDVLADPCPSVVWIFNETALGPNDSNITYNDPCMEETSTNLNIWTYILNVVLTSDTSGYYLANFTNIAGTTFLHRTYFTIPEPVSVVGLSLNDTCLKEGSNVSIRCNVRGFPRPTIEFRKNDIKITPGVGMFPNIHLEFYDQIIIKNVTMNDESFYSCTASATMGNLNQATQMFEFCTMPSITDVDITPNPRVGEPFFIECSGDGIPVPDAVWVKDGVQLEDDHNIRIVAIPARKSSRLEVSKASVDFNGAYQCILNNVAGSVMHSFVIQLMEAPAPLSLGLIIGIAVGGTLLVTALFCIMLVLVCVMCQRCVHDKSIKPQSANSYSFNIAYLENLRKNNEQLEAIYPLYDTIPYSDPAEIQTKGGLTTQTKEKERICKRAHVYDKICDAQQLVPSSIQTDHDTAADSNLETVIEDSPKDGNQMLEDDNKLNPKCLHDENEGKKEQKSQKINKQNTLHCEPVEGTKPKHPHSDCESMAKGGTASKNSDTEADMQPEMGKSRDRNDEPSQIYASISVEHKAKKRMKMLEKQQEDQKVAKNQIMMEERKDQKETNNQIKMEESVKPKKQDIDRTEAKMELEEESNQASHSKEENSISN